MSIEASSNPNQPANRNSSLCGSCKTENALDAKFCSGCGQSLQEECGKCGKSVLLTQTFCGHCGANLTEMVNEKKKQLSTALADAKTAANEFRYAEARLLLNRITAISDYRFKQFAATANRTLNKVIEIEEKTLETVAVACEKAEQAHRRGDKAEVVQHLSKIPNHLLDKEAKTLLANSESECSVKDSLETELRAAINAKDWETVGALVEQLLEADPQHQAGLKVSKKVSERLFTSAKKSMEQGNFPRVLEKLKSIPNNQTNEEIEKLLDAATEQAWILEELKAEPYASQTLLGFATKLCESSPRIESFQIAKQQLEKQLKLRQHPERMHLPVWKGKSTSWLGGSSGILSSPQRFGESAQKILGMKPAAFNVAIGLGLQGLGESRVADDFLIRKKGLFSSGPKKSAVAWGLDVGSSSVKGVLLEKDDKGIQIKDGFFMELEETPTRRQDASESRKQLEPAIKKFLELKDPGETPVWVNLDGAQTVNRFLRLPPVKDKDAIGLLNKEIESKIPIALDELCIVRWLCPGKRLPAMGRPGMVSTARTGTIIARSSLLESMGLKLAGLQSDTIALSNFVAYEFSEIWPDTAKIREEDFDQIQKDLSKTVCVIDAGATTTHILLVSGEAMWNWSIEVGGEDLTFQIASATKANRKNAEMLKRDPTRIEQIAERYMDIETRLDTLRSRLVNIHSDAMKQDNPFNTVSSWCVGGSWQTHQWIRRVMIK